METQAAPHRAKKRRSSDAPESPDQEGAPGISSPPAANAPDPNPPGAGGQEPEPGAGGGGGGEEDGVDYISRLPDAVLGEVISLLPTKDAARTQTLASRWRHLWRSAPLNLDCGEFLTDFGVVSRILSAHRGPGRRFRCSAIFLGRPAILDAWLQSPALDGLEEIDFWVESWWMSRLHMPPLPASTCRFASSLGVATLSQCHLPDDITENIRFPQLKKLALQHVSISEDSLHSLIAGCPVLECLLLRACKALDSVRINYASLISIGLSAQHHEEVTSLDEFVIESAPCLERFLYLEQEMGLQVSVIKAPKLETLGPLCYHDIHPRLALGSTIIQSCRTRGMHALNPTIPAYTVKNLAVSMITLSLDVIIDLMRCFPCLEKLYIQWWQGGDNNLWRRKHHDLIRCLDIRLKTIVLNN
ncbi:hypothetical protein HU200_052222 [Digitaria exilis]|uniref:F-box domain-containing protein n=1 Tax=Digitaria exilis TaxID=1010633 RepID=A0A835AZ48_9POAL|nr:hypothetical protein HU200_052222 [Digitaria exilis]